MAQELEQEQTTDLVISDENIQVINEYEDGIKNRQRKFKVIKPDAHPQTLIKAHRCLMKFFSGKKLKRDEKNTLHRHVQVYYE